MKASLLFSCAILVSACSPVVGNTEPDSEVLLYWEITAEEDGVYDMPKHSLALVVSGPTKEHIPLGTYSGIFSNNLDIQIPSLENVLMTGGFWWAGSGDEFIVQVADDILSISHRVADEQAEMGEFTVIQTYNISSGETSVEEVQFVSTRNVEAMYVGVVSEDCAPWDGPAVSMSLSPEHEPSLPSVYIAIWSGELPTSFTFEGENNLPMGEGYISYCGDGDCTDAKNATITFNSITDTVTGTVSVTLQDGSTINGKYTAVWDDSQIPLCG
jgi:hypothetical protein